MSAQPRTMYEKIWERHVVVPESADAPAVLAVDLHMVHEVTSPQAFATLKERGLRVRRPDKTLATLDHSTPTLPRENGGRGGLPIIEASAARQIEQLVDNCRAHGVRLYDLDSRERGIVHVIGPELGATRPGMTVVCGDSHTSTHGALGCLAFGIGTSEVAQVLATQCLLQRKSKAMAVVMDGTLGAGVSAKDMALSVMAAIGAAGGTGCTIEYAGSAVRGLSVEGRMTLCNMSIEAGARAGMVAPDETTFEYVRGRPMSPSGAAWERAVETWRTLPSDDGAAFDERVEIDVSNLEPMVTWGTSPGMAVPIGGRVPEPDGDLTRERALRYMGLEPGRAMAGLPINEVFIGSCTNSRIEDLRAAAWVLDGRRVADGVRVLVVPGSQAVKRQAEEEGLAAVFVAAGCEWREPGCSMCIAMNGDRAEAGRYVVSTSNRNFEGRQGAGSRTLLASPLTAAACAVAGCVADPREFLTEGVIC